MQSVRDLATVKAWPESGGYDSLAIFRLSEKNGRHEEVMIRPYVVVSARGRQTPPDRSPRREKTISIKDT